MPKIKHYGHEHAAHSTLSRETTTDLAKAIAYARAKHPHKAHIWALALLEKLRRANILRDQ